jgi:hypothetical protein
MKYDLGDRAVYKITNLPKRPQPAARAIWIPSFMVRVRAGAK